MKGEREEVRERGKEEIMEVKDGEGKKMKKKK